MPVPKTCGYVKEGLGMPPPTNHPSINYSHYYCIYIYYVYVELEGSTDDDDQVNIEDDSIDVPNNSVWLTDSSGHTTIDTTDNDDPLSAQPLRSKRTKRQADQYEYTPTKTRCPLLLVADYRFFQEMGGGNTKTTINYLVFVKHARELSI